MTSSASAATAATSASPSVLPWVLQDTALPNSFQEELDRHANIVFMGDDDRLRDHAHRIQGIFSYQHGRVSRALMGSLPQLKVVSNFGAGHEHIDLEGARHLDVACGNTPGVVGNATANMGMALLLAAARNVVKGVERTRNGAPFDPNWFGMELTGATMGIVGLGNVGSKVAARAKCFHMKTLYCGRTRKSPEVESELGAEFCENIMTMLPRCDVVMLCPAVTPSTAGMIGKKEFEAMKSTAILVNVARGKIVKTDELVTALQTGQIAQAALDVTEPEPLPKDHPFYTSLREKIIVTPHTGTATHATRHRMLTMAIANLEAGIYGKTLPTPI